VRLARAPRVPFVGSSTSRPVTEEDSAAERQRIVAFYGDVDAETRRNLVEPLIGDERPVEAELPAFASVMIGRDGRMWISEYERPTEQVGGEIWFSVVIDGRFECRAIVPEVDRLLEFGRDYVIALDRDDMGVERVVRYTLSAPRPSQK
jgi:hypothetical protein